MHAGGETGGVLTADDARRALSVGADVLVVSNHGDRHLGRAPVSLTALAEVRDEVGPDVPRRMTMCERVTSGPQDGSGPRR